MAIQRVKYILNSINEFKKKTDGTYEIVTGEEVVYEDGFQVSFVRPEAFVQLNKDQWDIITNYFCIYLNSEAHMGVYDGNAEVSFHCIPLDSAICIMEEYNQESILDWNEKNKHPDMIERWFIVNQNFRQEIVIDYGKVLEKIQ